MPLSGMDESYIIWRLKMKVLMMLMVMIMMGCSSSTSSLKETVNEESGNSDDTVAVKKALVTARWKHQGGVLSNTKGFIYFLSKNSTKRVQLSTSSNVDGQSSTNVTGYDTTFGMTVGDYDIGYAVPSSNAHPLIYTTTSNVAINFVDDVLLGDVSFKETTRCSVTVKYPLSSARYDVIPSYDTGVVGGLFDQKTKTKSYKFIYDSQGNKTGLLLSAQFDCLLNGSSDSLGITLTFKGTSIPDNMVPNSSWPTIGTVTINQIEGLSGVVNDITPTSNIDFSSYKYAGQ